MTYNEETMEIARKRADEIADQFYNEVNHLLQSGALEDENYSRGILFGVAIENIADGFLRGERKTKTYKNLKHF